MGNLFTNPDSQAQQTQIHGWCRPYGWTDETAAFRSEECWPRLRSCL